MSLLKGFREKKDKKDAKSFYLRMPQLKGDPREVRKLRSLISARLTAFIDTTFVDGAQKTEALQITYAGVFPGLTMQSAPFKYVKTLGGMICVYLPPKYANYFFELGSLYQRGSLTINQVLEFTDEMCVEISTALNLGTTVAALNFLRSNSDEEPDEESKEDSDNSSEEDLASEHEHSEDQ
jgi:hypothetical protein